MSIALWLLMVAGEPQIELSESRIPSPRVVPEAPMIPKETGPQVNLYKAGTLIYNPDLSKFPPQSIPNSNISQLWIEVGVIADGSIKSCQLMRQGYEKGDRFQWVEQDLCPDMMENGKFEFLEGVELKSKVGFHGFHVTWVKAPPVMIPFEYAKKDKGYEMEFFVFSSFELNKGECYSYDDRFSETEKQTICDTTLASKTYKNLIKSNGPVDGSNRLVFKTWLKKKPITEESSILRIIPTNSIIRRRVNIVDWTTEYEDSRLLNSADGNFLFNLEFTDNPQEIGYYDLKDVYTILEISPEGKVINCKAAASTYRQAIGANSYVIVDFKACSLLKQKGRFSFDDNFENNGQNLIYNYTLKWPREDRR